MASQRALGLSAIALGIGFNIPYGVLVAIFDYPQILRQPASDVLARFTEAGPTLVVTWYGFMLAALALVPVAIFLSVDIDRLSRRPAVAIGAAITGSLAGITQAIGLARWVFVVPYLSQHSDPALAAHGFSLLNAYGGVAIGEHLGQLSTALFVMQVAILQRVEHRPLIAAIGFVSAVSIALGTGEGLAIALEHDGAPFASATIVGFLALSAWLIGTGWRLMHSR